MTTVSSGSVRRESRERIRVAMSPPGRSVRPMEPAKRVSPEKRMGVGCGEEQSAECRGQGAGFWKR